MQALREWATAVVSACAVVAAVSFLVPSGIGGKAFKVVCGLFVILCFVSPLAKLEVDADAVKFTAGLSEWIEDNELEETVEKQIATELSDEIKSGISAYLDNVGDENYTVDVKICIDSSDKISVKYIFAEISNYTDEKQLSDFVQKQYGIVPEIKRINEEE